MYSSMIARQAILELIYTILFLIPFQLLARSPFEGFVIFGLFTIFLRVRTGGDFTELRVQNYLILRMIREAEGELHNLSQAMEKIFDAEHLLSQFTEGKRETVEGEYTGRLFSRAISLLAQAWMLIHMSISFI